MDEYTSVIGAIDVMGGNIDVSSYRVEESGGTRHGFIISSGRKEDENYRVIFESELDWDDGEVARLEGELFVEEAREKRWG